MKLYVITYMFGHQTCKHFVEASSFKEARKLFTNQFNNPIIRIIEF